uniref:Chitin-binding type-2 domain-containing protein n=1 Tax=Globodera pallida TaxID=36090 RepID=A0A183CLY4_GLOPA
MFSDESCLSSLLFPLILLFSSSKVFLNGALLANVQPRVNSINAFHSAINQLEPSIPNYCNESKLIEQSGLIRAPMGQFLGFPCSNEFYHCRWQSDGYRTYKKNCRTGLVYDVVGTQNCNYDYNVKGCAMGPSGGGGVTNCTSKDLFECPLSEDCVPLSKRCDGNYDCVLEEDEQNCPMCKPTHFPCVVSEQCIPLGQRCNGVKECQDGTDELECENCGAGKFLCRKSGKCIAAKERCDGFAQCPHGEDEQLCKKARIMLGPRMFVCESGKHQIPQQNVCDGVVHCPDDASDEKYCQPPVKTATETLRPMGVRTMPSPNAPPNQLATPAIETSKIAFDLPAAVPQQRQQQQMDIIKQQQEPWTDGGSDRIPGSDGRAKQQQQQNVQNPPSLTMPDIVRHGGEATYPILNFGPIRKASEQGSSKIQEAMKQIMASQQNMNNNGTNRLMVEVPRERKPQENKSVQPQLLKQQQQQQVEKDRAKTLVEGDFLAGVWNGSVLQQQQKNNPYADEWYQQQQQQQIGPVAGGELQQKIGQNNLIQEDGGQLRWSKFGSQSSHMNTMLQQQPQPTVIGRQQQLEQRRAVKEEEATQSEQRKENGEEIDGGSTVEPTTAQPQVEAGQRQPEGGQKVGSSSFSSITTATATTNGDSEQWRTKVPVITLGLSKEDGKEILPQSLATTVEAGDQQKPPPMEEMSPTNGGQTSERPELAEGGGDCESNGEKAMRSGAGDGAEVTGEQQQEQSQSTKLGTQVDAAEQQQTKQEQQVQDGQTTEQQQKEQQNERITGSVEEDLNTQISALKMEEGTASLKATVKDSEEQEQRAILRRLYSKYGSNARDLLQRVENLLLLAEDGIISAKKSPIDASELNGSSKSQKMKRRQAKGDRALVQRYLAQIIGNDGKKIERKLLTK